MSAIGEWMEAHEKEKARIASSLTDSTPVKKKSLRKAYEQASDEERRDFIFSVEVAALSRTKEATLMETFNKATVEQQKDFIDAMFDDATLRDVLYRRCLGESIPKDDMTLKEFFDKESPKRKNHFLDQLVQDDHAKQLLIDRLRPILEQQIKDQADFEKNADIVIEEGVEEAIVGAIVEAPKIKDFGTWS